MGHGAELSTVASTSTICRRRRKDRDAIMSNGEAGADPSDNDPGRLHTLPLDGGYRIIGDTGCVTAPEARYAIAPWKSAATGTTVAAAQAGYPNTRGSDQDRPRRHRAVR
jgi:hypothetical protein